MIVAGIPEHVILRYEVLATHSGSRRVDKASSLIFQDCGQVFPVKGVEAARFQKYENHHRPVVLAVPSYVMFSRSENHLSFWQFPVTLCFHKGISGYCEKMVSGRTGWLMFF